MKPLFRCKVCDQIRAENEYLKKLVDNLLERSAVRPVAPEEPPSAEEIRAAEEQAEKIMRGDVAQFGGDE